VLGQGRNTFAYHFTYENIVCSLECGRVVVRASNKCAQTHSIDNLKFFDDLAEFGRIYLLKDDL
jgi:hypothetical protein